MRLKHALTHWLRPSSSARAEAAAEISCETPLPFRSASRTHVGRVRMINEDRVLDDPRHGLWAIADGMGGHSAGDIAAEAAIASLQHLPQAGQIDIGSIETALQSVNQKLHRQTQGGARLSGATIVVMLAAGDRATILWAGDCRAYRLRDGRLDPLTRDHSVVQELLDAGAIDAEQASRHPQAHVVTRALGAGDGLSLDRVSIDIAAGDVFLLCSDGMPSAPAVVADALSRNGDALDVAAGLLLDQALAAGGQDNVSLVLVRRD